MPTYEYKCEKGHAFEEFQSIVADPIQVCPICGAKAQRQISAGSGLIFKGSGFYVTDYGRRSGSFNSESKSSHKEEKKSAADSTPATETPKTETKPGKTES